jgi:hypothetical protein
LDVSKEITQVNNEILDGASQANGVAGGLDNSVAKSRSVTPGASLDVTNPNANATANDENADPNAEQPIDWDRVGRVYKPESGI